VGDLVGVGPAERVAPQLAGAGRAQQLERVEKVLPGARGAVAADSVVQPSGAAGERLAVAAAAPRAAGGPAFERLEQREDRAVERPRWRGVEPAPGAPGPRSKQLREREPRGERALLDVALEGAPQRLDGLVEARQGEGLGQGPGRSEAARLVERVIIDDETGCGQFVQRTGRRGRELAIVTHGFLGRRA